MRRVLARVLVGVAVITTATLAGVAPAGAVAATPSTPGPSGEYGYCAEQTEYKLYNNATNGVVVQANLRCNWGRQSGTTDPVRMYVCFEQSTFAAPTTYTTSGCVDMRPNSSANQNYMDQTCTVSPTAYTYTVNTNDPAKWQWDAVRCSVGSRSSSGTASGDTVNLRIGSVFFLYTLSSTTYRPTVLAHKNPCGLGPGGGNPCTGLDYPEAYFTGGTPGPPARPPIVYDQAEPLGTCKRTLEPLDGKYYAVFTLDITNRPPAGPAFPGVGPYARDFVSLDLPWTAPTFDDDLYSVRVQLPAVADQPSGGWLPKFHLRRRLMSTAAEAPRGFVRPGVHEADYLIQGGHSGADAVYNDSEEVTLTCNLTIDLADPDKGAKSGLGGFTPDVEQTPENLTSSLEKCKPEGLGVLNPAQYVKATQCVLRVLFVPTVINPVATVKAEAEASTVADVAAIGAAANGAFGQLRVGAQTDVGCGGPTYNIPIGQGKGGGSPAIKPFSVCDGGTASLVGTGRTFGLLALYFSFAMLFMRLGAGALGWELPSFFGGGDSKGKEAQL